MTCLAAYSSYIVIQQLYFLPADDDLKYRVYDVTFLIVTT